MAVNHKGFIKGKMNDKGVHSQENRTSTGLCTCKWERINNYVFIKLYPSMPWFKPYEDVIKVIQEEYHLLVMVFRAD